MSNYSPFMFFTTVQHSLQDLSRYLGNFSVNNFAIVGSLGNWITFCKVIHVTQFNFGNLFFKISILFATHMYIVYAHTSTGSGPTVLPLTARTVPSVRPPSDRSPPRTVGSSLIPRSSGQTDSNLKI